MSKELDFLADLKELLKKHDVKIVSSEFLWIEKNDSEGEWISFGDKSDSTRDIDELIKHYEVVDIRVDKFFTNLSKNIDEEIVQAKADGDYLDSLDKHEEKK